MEAIEPAHNRLTNQAKHVLDVYAKLIPQNKKPSKKNVVLRQIKNIK